MAKENSKVKKVIKTLAIIGIAAGAVFAGYKAISNLDINIPQSNELKIVKNIQYDDSNYVFSWDAVANADAYITSINGETQQIETNAYFYVPTEEVTEFKVKAIDMDGEYKDSKWSDVYTYNVQNQEQQDLYTQLNLVVSDMLPGEDLKRIIGMKIAEGGKYLDIQVVCEYRGQEYFRNVRKEYDTPITSLKQGIEEGCIDGIGHGREIVDYNSAEYLLKSQSYDGNLEKYRKEGYKISIISSQTVVPEWATNDGSRFDIYGIFKLEKNGEIKYINVKYACGITNPSINPAINFTKRLQKEEDRIVIEESFFELTGDFAEYAQKMESIKKAASTYFGNTTNYSDQDLNY